MHKITAMQRTRSSIVLTVIVIAGLLFLLYYGARKITYDILLNTGVKLEQEGNIPAAVNFIERAARLAGSQSSLFARAGDIGIREYDAILVRGKKSTLGKEGALKVSLANYTDSLRFNPLNPWAWSGLGEYFERSSYLAEKRSTVNISKFSYGDLGALDYDDWMAIATVKKAIELEPYNYFYHDLLGFILMENNLKGEALKQYTRSLELYPLPDQHFFIPERKISSEMFAAIEDGLKKALTTNELFEKGSIYYQLGLWIFYQKRYKEAIDYFSDALKNGFSRYVILGNLGIISFIQHDYEKSLGYLLESTKGTHDKAYEIFLIGEIYSRRGDHAKALDYFKQAILNARQSSSKQMYLFRAAEEDERMGDMRSAETAYLDALQADPANQLAYSKIIDFYRKANNPDKVAEYMAQADKAKTGSR